MPSTNSASIALPHTHSAAEAQALVDLDQLRNPSVVDADATLSSSSSSSSPSVSSSSSTASTHHRAGINHMLAGMCAGAFQKTVIQPLDLVKTRLQVQDGAGKGEYRGVVHAFTSITRNEGLAGFYRGYSANLLGSASAWGVYFFVYNQSKALWRTYLMSRPHPSSPSSSSSSSSSSPSSASPAPPPRLSIGANLSCGIVAGAGTVLATNPIWLVKTRLQLQGRDVGGHERVYRGMAHAFYRIWADEGFLTFFRGVPIAMAMITNNAVQFATYEEMKKVVLKYWIQPSLHSSISADETHMSQAHFLVLGAIAKMISGSIFYPLAVVRARLFQRAPDAELRQTEKDIQRQKVLPAASPHILSAAPTAGAVNATATLSSPLNSTVKQSDVKYNNMRDVVRMIWKFEGVPGFYRGMLPMLLKTAPASALTFFGYENAIQFLNKNFPAGADTQEHRNQTKNNKREF